jgi:sugar phosphate isomerase/epimerase
MTQEGNGKVGESAGKWQGDLALHSVSYAGVWQGQARLTLEEFIPRAAALGYQSVMLMGKRPHLSLLDYDLEQRKRLRDLLDAHHLRVCGIAGYTDFTAGAERADIPLPEMQAVHVMELARAARDLGAPLVRIFTGYERPEQLGHHAAWSRCVTAVKDCARRAADFGVSVGVQNHHDLALHHESLLAFIEEVDEPNCRALFDAWAPALQGLSGDEMAAAVRLLGPHIVHTTVADYVRRPRFRYLPGLSNYAPEADEVQAVPMGHGFVDYATFFEALRTIGFQGSIAYEMCSPLRGGGSLPNLDACARQFLDYMAPRSLTVASGSSARTGGASDGNV